MADTKTKRKNGKRERIYSRDEQEWLEHRARDVTSTEISALFGISPYATLFELWHRKKEAAVVSIEQTDRMKWGTRLQDSIAAGIAADEDWTIRRMNAYMRLPDLRIGSSFDFSIGNDGLLEIKNVDGLVFREGWTVDGDEIEAPPHIELQVQHQLLVSGRKFAYIGALIGGNRIALIRREPDEGIIRSIRETVAGFWLSIEQGNMPTPEFDKDADFIAQLYGYAEPGKILNAQNDPALERMAAEHRDLGKQAAALTKERDALKARILMHIGDAEKVTGSQYTISAGVVGPSHVEYDRKAYRAFRVHWRKSREEAK